MHLSNACSSSKQNVPDKLDTQIRNPPSRQDILPSLWHTHATLGKSENALPASVFQSQGAGPRFVLQPNHQWLDLDQDSVFYVLLVNPSIYIRQDKIRI